MAKLGDFIAFKAAISLLKETGKESIINEVYKKAKESENLKREEVINHVKEIYKPLSAELISTRIAQMLKTPDINAEVKIVTVSPTGHLLISLRAGISGRIEGVPEINRSFGEFSTDHIDQH